MQNQTIFELYTDDNKSKYSGNPKDILKSEKKEKMKNSIPSKLPQLLLLIFFGKFLTERKYLINTVMFVRLFIKSINSETSNKPPVNDGPTAEFYKHFSNELAPFQMAFQMFMTHWGKLETMSVTYWTGIISAIYKR